MKKEHDAHACDEYQGLSRRSFMGLSATAAVAAGMPVWFPKITLANDGLAAPCPPCPMINLFGRGGWDGLSICVPYADAEYYNIRPTTGTLAYDPPGSGTNRACRDLNGFFGWPEIMGQIMGPAWKDSNLAFINAIGYTSNHSYSHFVGQHQLEVGQPAPPITLSTGWMGRHLESRPTPIACQSDPILRALALSIAKPRSMVGGVDCIATPSPSTYNLTGPSASITERLQVLLDMFTADGVYTDVAEQTVATIGELQQVDFDNYQTAYPAFPYPNTSIGRTFKAIAAILNNPVQLQVEAFTVDFGGWDTHSDQDPHNLINGRMHTRMRLMADALGSFYLDMRARSNLNWLLTAMTEFGRTAMENDSFGTDHAKGNCMFVMGGPVKGGVYGTWPGLDNLTGGGDDLPITTDIRYVFAEVVQKCLGNGNNMSHIFPNFPIDPVNFLGFL